MRGQGLLVRLPTPMRITTHHEGRLEVLDTPGDVPGSGYLRGHQFSMRKHGLKIAFFGSSLLSTYDNHIATYYRGIVRQLHEGGHQVTFFEPDVPGRQQCRDLPAPQWARVVVYAADEDGVYQALAEAQPADVIIKASHVGAGDEVLESAVLTLQDSGALVVFWDVDAPATLARLTRNPADPLVDYIPRYNLIVVRGNRSIVERYKALGARRCLAICGAVDSEVHYPVAPEARFQGALGFLGDCLPGYEAQVEEFFLKPAMALAPQRFLLGGRGWGDKRLPDSVTYVGHVDADSRNAFYCSPLAVLNLNPSGEDRYGFLPAPQLFEAAGAGACLITGDCKGVEDFLEPGREVLVAGSGDEVIDYLNKLTVVRAYEIGQAARRRVLAEHTYAHHLARLEAAVAAEMGSPLIRTVS